MTRCTGNRLSSIYLPTINIKYYFELSACVPISFIGFVVLRLSLFSTRDDYLLQLTQNDLTHELTYKTFFFDISLRESYTLKRNLSTRRSFLSRHHLQRDHHSFESTCSDSEENYACMRPSFPGGKQGREKWLLYPLSKGYAIPILSTLETSSRRIARRPVAVIFFFSFPTCAFPRAAPRFNARDSNNLRAGVIRTR